MGQAKRRGSLLVRIAEALKLKELQQASQIKTVVCFDKSRLPKTRYGIGSNGARVRLEPKPWNGKSQRRAVIKARREAREEAE